MFSPSFLHDLKFVLRAHYAYYGIAGRALQKVYRAVERYWRRCSRNSAGRHLTWTDFNQLKEDTRLLRPKLYLPYQAPQAFAVLQTNVRRA